MASKVTRGLALALFMGCAAAMAAGASLYIFRNQLIFFSKTAFNDKNPAQITVVVDKGSTPKQIAKKLKDSGVILDDVAYYRWLHYVAKLDTTLKAGTYVLSATMTPEEITKELQTGRVPEVRVTIPEGLRKEEVAQILADSGFGKRDDIIKLMNQPGLAKEFGVPEGVPGGIEGYLFPDTYQFAVGASADSVVRKMHQRVTDVLADPKRQARMKEMGWSAHKVLTLAAIVEKETGQPEERPRIAGLFHARLKQGMKLQTDPTVIYGIPNYDGNIRRKDLDREHAYNTYHIPALPPGPIAQPGRAAIDAVLFPEDTLALYFVAKGDSGFHEFCPTYECHLAAVQKWQIEFFQKKPKP
jgi:UPF0755 protein